MKETKGKIIQSVQRAINIIKCFEDIDTELSLGQVSEMVALNKSTAYGLLNTLHANGFLYQTTTGKYKIGESIKKYGLESGVYKELISNRAAEGMRDIAQRFNLPCCIYMQAHGRLLLLSREAPSNAMYIVSLTAVPEIRFFSCTASGKILLLFQGIENLEKHLLQYPLEQASTFSITTVEELIENLKEIKRNGYSVENEELAEGVSAIAVPILMSQDQLFGTLSVTGTSFQIAKNKNLLTTALKKLSRDLMQEFFHLSIPAF